MDEIEHTEKKLWVPTREAFWSRVDMQPHGCWLWTGPLDKDGYGRYSSHRTHKLAYEFAYGPVPGGAQLNHTCHSEACCRPCHLYPGTQYENMQDRKARGGKWEGGHPLTTHCRAGHLLADHARVYPRATGNPKYVCRVCESGRRKRYQKRKANGDV